MRKYVSNAAQETKSKHVRTIMFRVLMPGNVSFTNLFSNVHKLYMYWLLVKRHTV